jgi:hypothetical protein
MRKPLITSRSLIEMIYSQKKKTIVVLSSLSFLAVLLVSVNFLIYNLNLNSSSKANSLGNTYYVSPTGNDSNTGLSTDQAWQTIDKVNRIQLQAGESILFEGGKTFSGKIILDSLDKGTPLTPVTISSYGTGRATITSTSNAAYIYNTSGVNFQNLNFTSANGTANTSSGLNFYTDLGQDQKLEALSLTDIEVSGFGGSGIEIGGWNQKSGFKNIKMLRVISHDNATGISTYGQAMYANANITIQNSKVYNNLGTCTEEGNGIVLGSVDVGLIEHTIAYNNGSSCYPDGGAVGIWAYDANKITFQYNESYSNKTGESSDGDGFDFDQNVSNSLMQYNYSHNNDGAGYLLAHSPNNLIATNNILRYNISENDGRKAIYGAITVWGRFINTEIYNNTIYITPSTNSNYGVSLFNDSIESNDVKSFHFRNNIIQTTGGVPLVYVKNTQLDGAEDLLYQNNSYYSTGGNFSIKWGSSTYNSLDSWRSATGQEKVGSLNVGLISDPQLSDPGTGGTIGNTAVLNALTAYKLKSTSPLINKGLDLQTAFAVNPGTSDFYGNTIPLNGSFDIGAHEYENGVTPTPTNTPIPVVTTTTFKVITGNDDAEERISTKSVNLSDSDLELGADGSNPQIVGLRFQKVTIPKNAVIKESYLEFLVDESKTATTNLSIYGQATDNAAAFTTSSGNISSRAKTQGNTQWNSIPSWTTIDSMQKSPDISSIISEITSRTNWASNNSLVLTLTGTGTRTARSYNTSSSKQPRLVIKYETAGTSVTPTITASPTPTATPVTTLTPTATTIPSGTLTLTPTADTYVHSGTPTTNFGTKTSLTVVGSPVAISYMKFDLTGLAGSTITSAKIKLKVTNDSSNVHSLKLLNNSSWVENTMTYNTRIDTASTPAVTTFIPNVINGFVELDISSVIQNNVGTIITLAIDSSGTNTSAFNSREASADKPVLVVNKV